MKLLLEIAPQMRGDSLLGDIPGSKTNHVGYQVGMHQLVYWQLGFVAIAALVGAVFGIDWAGVMLGGLLVVGSTWHVHKSVVKAEGNRNILYRLAGVRFAVMLVLLTVAVYVLSIQPLGLIVGMASAYIAMYIKSLMMIYKIKGDSLG